MEIKFNVSGKKIVVGCAIIAALWLIFYFVPRTPEFSLFQISRAVSTHDKSLGLKYIDKEKLFDGLWASVIGKAKEDAGAKSGFEAIGYSLGVALIEGMKPAIQEKFNDGIDSIFDKNATTSNEIAGSQKYSLIQRKNGKTFIENQNGIRLIFTKENDGIWRITGIEGIDNLNQLSGDGADKKTTSTLAVSHQGQSTNDSIGGDLAGIDLANFASGGTPEVITKNIGDTIEFTTQTFKVNDAKESNIIVSGLGEATVAKSGAKYIILKVSTINKTNSQFNFSNRGTLLIDEKGRSYDIADSQWNIENYLEGRKLSSDIPEVGVIYYEIAKDAQHYSMISGKAGTNIVYKIDLK